MKRHERQLTQRRQTDLRLAILDTIRPPGVALSQQQIADAAGCSVQTVYDAERSAMQKLRDAARRLK